MKKFKLVTLLGIRPDIIRMQKLLKLLEKGQDKVNYQHFFVHTGQHYDYELDEIFYRELNVKKPIFNFHIGKILKERGGPATHAYQSALLFQKLAAYLETYKPHAIIYLGDTNTVLSSIIAARYQVPVIHIEGGGRSYDWRMPEEKNRLTVDHLSDAIYCYLPRYQKILLSEGIPNFRIKVTGNLIDDALKAFLPLSQKREILKKLNIKKKDYLLVTLHREENVQNKKILSKKITDLAKLAKEIPLVFPVMPNVLKFLKQFDLLSILNRSRIVKTAPLGFLDFLKLETDAKTIITDSGTVQEEALILGVPCLVTRRSTERPETITAGATILAETNLYENAVKTLNLKTSWDKTILNPSHSSPSQIIFEDLMSKIENNYFQRSRTFNFLKANSFVQEAYNQFRR